MEARRHSKLYYSKKGFSRVMRVSGVNRNPMKVRARPRLAERAQAAGRNRGKPTAEQEGWPLCHFHCLVCALHVSFQSYAPQQSPEPNRNPSPLPRTAPRAGASPCPPPRRAWCCPSGRTTLALVRAAAARLPTALWRKRWRRTPTRRKRSRRPTTTRTPWLAPRRLPARRPRRQPRRGPKWPLARRAR
jgi:hypothetical protein